MEKEKLTSVFKMLVASGEAILKVYNSDNYKTTLKTDKTPVTRADKASSEIINRRLKVIFPKIPVLDEEAEIPDYSVRKNWQKFFQNVSV